MNVLCLQTFSPANADTTHFFPYHVLCIKCSVKNKDYLSSVFSSIVYGFFSSGFDLIFSLLAKRLAGKSVSVTTYLVSSRTLNLNQSVNQDIVTLVILTVI